MGYLAWIRVAKHSEMGARCRPYKGQVVLLGSQVVEQYHDEATFRDMGTSPATSEPAIAADFPGRLQKWLTVSKHASKLT